MRQHHAAGDKVVIDYSGKKIGIVDPETRVVSEAEIFVAVLGASNYTYAEATWTQTLPDWIGARVRMAAHYGVVVLPARPRKPRDKAKVEAGVRFAQSYILRRLRHQTFFSLGEVNAAIAVVLGRINGHVMRRLGVSRRDLFASVEGPALKPLPEMDYEFAEWRLARSGSTITWRFKASSTRRRIR